MKAIADRDSGFVYEAASITVGEYLGKWLGTIRHALRHGTFRRYEEAARIHIKPTLGKVRLSRLDALQLQSLYQQKRDEGLSPCTVQIIRATAHKALKQAVKWSLVPRNVAEAVDPPRAPKAEIKPLTTEQAKKLLAAAEKTQPKLYALYLLAITMGMRQGELLGLKWADIDLEMGTLRVQRTVFNGQVNTPKTSKSRRSISLPTQLPTLSRNFREPASGSLAAGPEPPSASTTCTTALGSPCSRRRGSPARGTTT